MRKIKVIFYSHTIDYGGTWRAHERILLNLNRDEFDPYVLYWKDCPQNNRLDILCKKLEISHVIPFSRSKQKLDANHLYTPINTNFHEVADSIKPDIIHFARSGYPEWPFNQRMCKLQVETNIFGYKDNTGFCDRHIAISDYIMEKTDNYCDAVVWNPIDEAVDSGYNLRTELNIPENAIVCGRIGRTDNYTPIALDAFRKLCKKYELFFLIIGADLNVKEIASKNPRIIVLDTTNDDDYINSFFRTIDIFCHYRIDGETQGMSIAQAMMYKKPVISHFGTYNNGQIDTIGQGGKVCKNRNEYTNYLRYLIVNPEERKKIGSRGFDRANSTFRTDISVRKMSELYKKWLR